MQIRKEVQAAIYDKRGTQLIVLLVKKMDLKNYNYRWRLLKGGIEGNESEQDAVRREVSEEVGLTEIMIGDRINEYDYSADVTHHQVATYLVKADSRDRLKIQTEEIADAVWMPADQAIRLLFWRNEKESLTRLVSKMS